MNQVDRTPIVLLGSAVVVLLIALYWIGTETPAGKIIDAQPNATTSCDEHDGVSEEKCAPTKSATGGQTSPAGGSQLAPSTDWLNEDVATKPLNPFQGGLGMDPALTDVFDGPPATDE